nr:MAG TPA: hypothetical protein [Caudoviricetes sp.]
MKYKNFYIPSSLKKSVCKKSSDNFINALTAFMSSLVVFSNNYLELLFVTVLYMNLIKSS